MGERVAKRVRSLSAASAGLETTVTPKLRCWQTEEGPDLHLAGNLAGAARLVQAVDELGSAPRAKSVVLAMTDEPFDAKRNPMWFAGVKRVFQRLRLERTDDPAQVERMYAHALDAKTAEIRLSPSFLPAFLAGCRRMAEGQGDFCVGYEHARQRWKMTTLDRRSGEVWFWGERETPITFRKR